LAPRSGARVALTLSEAKRKGRVRGGDWIDFVSFECQVDVEVRAAVAERQRRQRRRLDHRAQRGAIERTVAGLRFGGGIADGAVTIDDELYGHCHARGDLRPEPVL